MKTITFKQALDIVEEKYGLYRHCFIEGNSFDNFAIYPLPGGLYTTLDTEFLEATVKGLQYLPVSKLEKSEV